jgi:hypothetical protein
VDYIVFAFHRLWSGFLDEELHATADAANVKRFKSQEDAIHAIKTLNWSDGADWLFIPVLAIKSPSYKS